MRCDDVIEAVIDADVMCGGFTENSLWQAGCAQVYPGPAAILACFADSLLAR